jgi:2-polyprenyl-3-methyl-5-hydroxy-6-metoxy-1,4-benzoquinol methylase
MTLQDYLDFLFAHGGRQLAKSLALWKGGIDYERDFWKTWFTSAGGRWPDEFHARMNNRELLPFVKNRLPQAGLPVILDVGAGPATNIGSMLPGRDVRVLAVDPLAPIYDEIIQQAAISPPVRTQFAFAEDLSSRFDPSSIDVITCTNALDHAIEPAWGIIEMLIILRREGRMYLGHNRNEAEAENYCGFHQWNFDVQGSDFIVWNKQRTLNVSQMLRPVADIKATMPVENWVVIDGTKTAETPVELLGYQRRVRASLLEAMLLDMLRTPASASPHA